MERIVFMDYDYASRHGNVKTHTQSMPANSDATRYAMPMMTADDIRKILKKTGWTQVRLAKHVGVNQSTVSRWLTGEQVPYPRQQELLLQLLEPRDRAANSKLADQIYAAIEGVLLEAGLPEDDVKDMLRLSHEACDVPLEDQPELAVAQTRRAIARALARKFLKPR